MQTHTHNAVGKNALIKFHDHTSLSEQKRIWQIEDEKKLSATSAQTPNRTPVLYKQHMKPIDSTHYNYR